MTNFRKLNRPTGHRMSMLRTMVSQLVKHERIETTVAKAKEIRRLADNMVQLGKDGMIYVSWRRASKSNCRQFFDKVLHIGLNSSLKCNSLPLQESDFYIFSKQEFSTSLNVAAGLLGFFFVKSWTSLLAKMGFSVKPFARQKNAVIQTCVVACYGIAFSGHPGWWSRWFMVAGRQGHGCGDPESNGMVAVN